MSKPLSPDFRAGWRDAITLFEFKLELLARAAKVEGKKVAWKDIVVAVREYRDEAPRFSR